MNFKDAAKRIENHAPQDAANVVRTSVDGEARQPFDAASLADARNYLHTVMKVRKELDDNLITCKEFENKNRAAVR